MDERKYGIAHLAAVVVITAIATGAVVTVVTRSPSQMAQGPVTAVNVPQSAPEGEAAGEGESAPAAVPSLAAEKVVTGPSGQAQVVAKSEPVPLTEAELAALEIPAVDDRGVPDEEPREPKPEVSPPAEIVEVETDAGELMPQEEPQTGESVQSAGAPASEVMGSSTTYAYGTICPSTAKHWYQFSASAGDLVTIAMDRLSGGLDCYLELRDPAGRLLTYDDDSGGGTNALIVGYSLPQSGIHYIIASSYRGASTGSYRLTLTRRSGVGYPGPSSRVAVQQIWTADQYDRPRSDFGCESIRYLFTLRNPTSVTRSVYTSIRANPPCPTFSPPIYEGMLAVAPGSTTYYLQTGGVGSWCPGRYQYYVEVNDAGSQSSRDYYFQSRCR